MLFVQLLKTRMEQSDLTDINRDVLGQRRLLLNQTERVRVLSLQLSRAESQQKAAEARCARLEALCPLDADHKELRTFELEAGLLKFLNRLTLLVSSLRQELGSAVREPADGDDEGHRLVELAGDKVILCYSYDSIDDDLNRGPLDSIVLPTCVNIR